MSSPFRIYRPLECGEDGYPLLWHRNVSGALDDLILGEIEMGRGALLPETQRTGLKHIVRSQANHRCIRCRHPFVVGRSGVMEGPTAESRALAAEMGVSQEELDASLEDTQAIWDTPAEKLEITPRTNWSACDSRCRHGGPMRVWVRDQSAERWENFDPTPDACGPAVGALLDSESKAEAAWRILTVHHLNEVKADLRWWNLVALCQRCHLLIQRKVVMDRPWPWQHTDWFQPYVAAFYAMKYLGEELDRDDTEARQAELLELGAAEESVERMAI